MLDRLRRHVGAYQPTVLPGEGHARAAVALLCRQMPDGDLGVLFIRRAVHPEDPWSGHMALPGGRVDADDESHLATAHRETREEVGIDLAQAGELVGQLDDVQADGHGKTTPLVITPFVFALSGPVEVEPNYEVQEVIWVSLSQIEDPFNRSTLPYAYDGRALSLPCIEIEGRVVWGLTYRMVMSLVRLLRSDRASSRS